MDADGGQPRDPAEVVLEAETLRRENESLKRTRRPIEETRRLLGDAKHEEGRGPKQ
jgi:hypothetical protein